MPPAASEHPRLPHHTTKKISLIFFFVFLGVVTQLLIGVASLERLHGRGRRFADEAGGGRESK